MLLLVLVAALGIGVPAMASPDANTCNGSSELNYPTAPNFTQVGDVVHIVLSLGAGGIQGGTTLHINRVRFDLDCQNTGLGLPCTDEGAIVSYQGNLTDTCAGVTFQTTHTAGDFLPNEVVFDYSSGSLNIPANTAAFCQIEFDVMVAGLSTDGTPNVIEQVSGYNASTGDGVCDTIPQLAAGNSNSGSIRLCICGDGNPCNGDETCDPNGDPAGDGCVGGTPVDCDDNDPCTSDSCDPTSKGDPCVNTPGALDCNDNDPCTSDSCVTGTGCVNTPGALDCDDEDPCTSDACVTGTGCVNTPGALDCDDEDPCTSDACVTGTGCVNTPGALDCDDEDPCTSDACVTGTGCVNTPGALDCNDDDPCTSDTCETGTGCVNTPGALDCNDDDPCTSDECVTGTGCVNTPGGVDCDDENPCTDDSCVAGEGCVNEPNGDPSCTLPCRITGGGIVFEDTGAGGEPSARTDPNIFAEVQRATFGGQVGAPFGIVGCHDDFDSIQGSWTHLRHRRRGSFHASDFNSLVCGCDDGQGGPGNLDGNLCNPDDPEPGPEHPQAPANIACWTGVGEYNRTNGRRTITVAFRVEVEDRGEPGAGNNSGTLDDSYRILIWIPTNQEDAVELAAAACCTNENPDIRPPDVTDGGNLIHGNLQIHKPTGNPNNP